MMNEKYAITDIIEDDIAKTYFVGPHYIWEGKERSRPFDPHDQEEYEYMTVLMTRDNHPMVIWTDTITRQTKHGWFVEIYFT